MNETKLKPGYYAVIPASVRYDETLPPNAKLLYGEVTALCNLEGFCWAGNRYFAELYGVKVRAVQTWIAALEAAGHILVEPIDGFKRHIRLPEAERAARVKKDTGLPHAKKDTPLCKKSHAGMTQNTRRGAKNNTHNTTENLTTNNTKSQEVSLALLPERKEPEKAGPEQPAADAPPHAHMSRARRQLVKGRLPVTAGAVEALAREMWRAEKGGEA